MTNINSTLSTAKPKANPNNMNSLKTKFGKLSDSDLTAISQDPSLALGKIQSAYGYSKEKAAEEYKNFQDGEK